VRDDCAWVELAARKPGEEELAVGVRVADREPQRQLALEHQRIVERVVRLEVRADDGDGAAAAGEPQGRVEPAGRARGLDHHVRA
jgi:hypothetical protein